MMILQRAMGLFLIIFLVRREILTMLAAMRQCIREINGNDLKI